MKKRAIPLLLALITAASVSTALSMRFSTARAATPKTKPTPKAMPLADNMPGYWQKVTGLPCAAEMIAPQGYQTSIPTMLVCKNGQMFVFRQQ